MSRDLVFFSYSHKDGSWLEEFRQLLAPAVHAGMITPWDDSKIDPGSLWKTEIEHALRGARVGVLLVSKHFLASRFIRDEELPPLLDAARREGMALLWVYVSACLYNYTSIADYQAAHDISKPLELHNKPKRTLICKEICELIVARYNGRPIGTDMFRQRNPAEIAEAVNVR